MKIKPEKDRVKRCVLRIETYDLKITYDPVAWAATDLKKIILSKINEEVSLEKFFADEIEKGMMKIEKEEL